MSKLDKNQELAFVSEENRKLTEELILARKQIALLTEGKEKHFRAIIENSNDIISLNDAHFKVLYRSPSSQRITGWGDEEMNSTDGTRNIHPDDLPHAKNVIKESIAHPGKPIPYIFRNLHKDGHYMWLEGTIINLLDDDDIKAFVFNSRDITERKKLEVLLQKAYALARIGSWEVDILKGSVYWSDITREIHETESDYRPNLTAGINFYKEGAARDLVSEKVRESIEEGKSWDIEVQIVTAKGNVRWVRTIGEVEFVNGKCIRLYGSFQDIDQRKKTEEIIAKTLDDKNTILESIGDAFFAVDNEWVVTYWNRIAEMDLKVTKLQVVNKNLWEVFSDSVDSVSYRKYHEAILTNQVVHFEDYYSTHNKWYEISAYPSENGLSVFFKDITKRKKDEKDIKRLNEELESRVIERTEKLMNANRELEQFAYIASHDLQEPLRTVSNYMKVFEEDYMTLLDENAITYIQSVNMATKRMSDLIKSLLTFSKLGHSTQLIRIDLTDVIKDVMADLEIAIRSSGAIIDVLEMPEINAYETEIRQVFQNLIINAIKFQKANSAPKIQISAHEIRDGWRFSVRDNGIGIDPIYFQRIFDIFQRLETKENYDGSGIGLANCKKIVQLHKGEIWIESIAGQGSTFHFTIPNLTL